MKHSGIDEVGPPPPAAAELFGDGLDRARGYAQLLATEGITRGVIGPRERERLWERHLLNCAALAPVLPDRARVCDLGSGAGLPGLVVAIARPEVAVTALEPMQRRVEFLLDVVAALGLTNVEVQRARAEEFTDAVGFDAVLARAVAPLDRLAGWALPLLHRDGELLAIKGRNAEAELSAAAPTLRRLRTGSGSVQRHGHGLVDPPVTVVRVPAGRPGAATGNGERPLGRRPGAPGRGPAHPGSLRR